METVTDFIFLGSKITADGDCSHEIKRCLLLGRKAMTNLDSILKGLSSQSYGFSSSHVWCEGWTIKKAERWRIDAFELEFWRTARRSNQSILKEISPEYSLEGLMLKLKLHPILCISRSKNLSPVSLSSKAELFTSTPACLPSPTFLPHSWTWFSSAQIL